MFQIQQLSKSFRNPVLKSVDFTLKKNQVISLMGNNGSGKTTLIKVIASIIFPDSGQLSASGSDYHKEKTDYLYKTGIVLSEKRSFYQNLTGLQNIKFYAEFNKIDTVESTLFELADQLGFERYLFDRPIREYSSGQSNILSVMRAFITKPAFVFIDDITGSLDEDKTEMFYNFLRSSAKKKQAILCVTHSEKDAQRFTDKLVRLHDGVITDV